MGSYKDKNGKTRVGVFLKEVAPDLLNVAGNLTGITALNALSDAIDGSSELNPAQKAYAQELLSVDLEFEKQITSRHKTDMASDSWLSKNIRPMALIFLLIITSFMAIVDAGLSKFNLPEGYLSLYTQLLLMVFAFYFVGREINKGIINFKNHKS